MVSANFSVPRGNLLVHHKQDINDQVEIKDNNHFSTLRKVVSVALIILAVIIVIKFLPISLMLGAVILSVVGFPLICCLCCYAALNNTSSSSLKVNVPHLNRRIVHHHVAKGEKAHHHVNVVRPSVVKTDENHHVQKGQRKPYRNRNLQNWR